MKPLNALVLHQSGEDEGRIGTLERVNKYALTKHIEELLDVTLPLPCSADISPIHPPYFNEFSYNDVFGGLLLKTLSAEINARLTAKIVADSYVPSKAEISRLEPLLHSDKYKLSSVDSDTKLPKKVIFLPGGNVFEKAVDKERLYELMADQQWFIKMHPLSQDKLQRSLGMEFGYHRILGAGLSGLQVLSQCTHVCSTATSEMALQAFIQGKAYIDITKYSNLWMFPYVNLVVHCIHSDNPLQMLYKLLLHPASGFLASELGDVEERIARYSQEAMYERDKFTMLTNQQLVVKSIGVKYGE